MLPDDISMLSGGTHIKPPLQCLLRVVKFLCGNYAGTIHFIMILFLHKYMGIINGRSHWEASFNHKIKIHKVQK